MELDETNMSQPTFSIILPLYRQAEQIPLIIRNYTQMLSQMKESWELLLVINGSTDNSWEVAKKNIDNPSVKIHHLQNSGWGKAVKLGISAAQGKYICYTNSARTQMEDLKMMLKYALVNDYVVVKATRIMRENLLRKAGSTLYNIENRILFRTPVWDVNGTPKILPRNVLEKISIQSENDLIDAEILAKCFRQKIPIIEIPVLNTKRISGRSTTDFLSALKMYWGLFRLKQQL